MGKVLDEIPDDLAAFIRAQHVFFVATAPLTRDGHVNLSPKGLDTFRILSPKRVAYADMTGSGNETSAHLAENSPHPSHFLPLRQPPKTPPPPRPRPPRPPRRSRLEKPRRPLPRSP